MTVQIKPDLSRRNIAREILRPILLPPDKSIFHRLLIIGSLTKSKIRIPISAIEEIPVDVYATILALQSLGVPIEINRSDIVLQGVGINGFHEPKHKLNCANSGTTARLMMGLLAGQPFTSILTGDDSLSKRPMKRLADLLNNDMGADILCSENGTLPVTMKGRKLHSAMITSPVASAQIKTSLLLAGLQAGVDVQLTEPLLSRNHTELMLQAFGSDLTSVESTITIKSDLHFTSSDDFTYHLPGDISSAAFLIGAAILSKKNITLHNVGLNPTRRKFLDILIQSGLEMEFSNLKEEFHEKRGSIEIFAADSSIENPFEISEEDIPLLIDEIPLLAVLASFCNGETRIPGAGELRNKESDRLSSVVANLNKGGANAFEKDNGIIIKGDLIFQPENSGFEHYGDHRIAMAFSIMALRAKEPVTIFDASVVSISYPNFFQDLAIIAGSGRINIS